jgi:hypothetical protein
MIINPYEGDRNPAGQRFLSEDIVGLERVQNGVIHGVIRRKL